MSALNYVVIYHRNGMTSLHSLSAWSKIRSEFAETRERILTFENPFGGEAVMFRSEMESIYLVTEDEAEWNSQRHAAFEKLDKKSKEEWS